MYIHEYIYIYIYKWSVVSTLQGKFMKQSLGIIIPVPRTYETTNPDISYIHVLCP